MHHIFFFYLLVDGGPEVNGQRSLLGLGDNDVETLKKAVKAQEKIETEEWFEDDDAEEESSDEEEEDEDGEDENDKDMELFYFTTALDARLCSVKKESCDYQKI